MHVLYQYMLNIFQVIQNLISQINFSDINAYISYFLRFICMHVQIYSVLLCSDKWCTYMYNIYIRYTLLRIRNIYLYTYTIIYTQCILHVAHYIHVNIFIDQIVSEFRRDQLHLLNIFLPLAPFADKGCLCKHVHNVKNEQFSHILQICTQFQQFFHHQNIKICQETGISSQKIKKIYIFVNIIQKIYLNIFWWRDFFFFS
eukprot:TRINITY_DN13214_c0_g1_i1.p2 TRINITY_DN13214_c0_g1~~TRINITY_DN13214_c0_g1_i1.p2  ORF type:complete len:201 (+),score=-35.62 TRINITY_DN13214_c0_g1_i1:138-740(+)